MLANATSTLMSPLEGPMRYEAIATRAPQMTDGQMAASPWTMDLMPERT